MTGRESQSEFIAQDIDQLFLASEPPGSGGAIVRSGIWRRALIFNFAAGSFASLKSTSHSKTLPCHPTK